MPQLSGRRKAAALLVLFGPEISCKIFKHLSQEQCELLTQEVAQLGRVTVQERDAIIDEFHQLIKARNFIVQGGPEYAKQLLEMAFGQERAEEIFNRLLKVTKRRPFDFLRNIEPAQLVSTLQNEHPQTIAVVLANLPTTQASMVFAQLPAELQADVSRRIATMQYGSERALSAVESALKQKLGESVTTAFLSTSGGIDKVVDILNASEREVERAVLESIDEKDPELAEEIRRRMFKFEDILRLDDRSTQRVLREVDTRDLAVAMKGASDELKDKVFRNLPKRTAAMLQEEMEYLGPMRLSDVEEAQQKVINIIRQLEDAGEIVVARGKGKEQIVV